MKVLIVSLLFPVLLKSCDGSADQIGRKPDPVTVVPPPPQGAGDPNSPGGTNDVPIDGGLGILLAAGVTYGVRRFRKNAGNGKQSSSI